MSYTTHCIMIEINTGKLVNFRTVSRHFERISVLPTPTTILLYLYMNIEIVFFSKFLNIIIYKYRCKDKCTVNFYKIMRFHRKLKYIFVFSN